MPAKTKTEHEERIRKLEAKIRRLGGSTSADDRDNCPTCKCRSNCGRIESDQDRTIFKLMEKLRKYEDVDQFPLSFFTED